MGIGANTKLKVLLVQLPHPSNVSRNVPLAAGYLKAWAHHCQLLDEVEIEILHPDYSDRSGCQRLVDLITEKSPDILGVTLYLWNVARTLFIAEQIKKRLPNLRLVAGGPEVSLYNSQIIRNDLIDFLVVGEGEATFVDLLRHFLRQSPEPSAIPGLAFRQEGCLIVNSARPPLERLELLPSPYLLGYIDPMDYQEMMIFTMRGCLQGCSYCAWSARGRLRAFGLEQLRDEVHLAYKMGKEAIVSIADSAFNTSPVFREFCTIAREINLDKRLRFNCFVQAECIDQETAQLLRESHVVGVEVGLQSVSAEVLHNVCRSVELNRFKKGMEILKKENIPVVVDTILGLPGDTLSEFEKTMGFLTEHNFKRSIFNLSISEGSSLRGRIQQFGIKTQEAAPFYVRSSASFPQLDMEEAMRRYLAFSADFNPLNDLQYPEIARDQIRASSGDEATILKQMGNLPERPVTNLVVPLRSIAGMKTLASLSEMIANHSANHLLVLCQAEERMRTEDLDCLQTFILGISSKNPFITWDIVFEGSGYDLQQEVLDRMHACLFKSKVFLDYQYEMFPADVAKICRSASNLLAIFPWTAGCDRPLVHEKNCIMKVAFGTDTLRKIDLAGLLECYGSAILVDFSAIVSLDLVTEVMQKIFDMNPGGKSIYFKDWVLQRIWEQDFLRITPGKQSRYEILIDRNGAIYAKNVTDTDLFWDALTRWRLMKPEYSGIDINQFIMQKVSDRLSLGAPGCEET